MEVIILIPLYIGAKITLKYPNVLCDSSNSFYLEHGYVYIKDIWDNGNILVGGEGASVTIDRNYIEDVFPDGNILDVLRNKRIELVKIQKDIDHIEEYINWRCSPESVVNND